MFSNVKPAYFRRHFEAAREASPQTAHATSEFDASPAARGTRYFLASDGVEHWGYAIRADGELVYVFSTTRGKGSAIVTDAIERGAVYLDCFVGHLTTLYARHGFRNVRTVPNWTPGQPAVAYMSLPGFEHRHGVTA